MHKKQIKHDQNMVIKFGLNIDVFKLRETKVVATITLLEYLKIIIIIMIIIILLTEMIIFGVINPYP